MEEMRHALFSYLTAVHELEVFLRLYPVSNDNYDGFVERRDAALDRLWLFFPELDAVRKK